MTKNEELNALADFIGRLPEDSYLKPMLARMQPDIERDIRSDFVPDPYPALLRLRELCRTQQAELDRIKGEITDRTADARNACAELAGHRKLLREWASHHLPDVQRLQALIIKAAHA
jgi:hypothetical protein